LKSKFSIQNIDEKYFEKNNNNNNNNNLIIQQQQQQPWNISLQEFCLFLLQEHLIPGLKFIGSQQDRSGFAIQNILKILAKNILLTTNDNNNNNNNTINNEINNITSVDNNNNNNNNIDFPMPNELHEILVFKNIFEITQPFWMSNYQITDAVPTRAPPIYFQGF
jgi:hypothetical protein